jgi:hypothetical protein
MKKLLTSVMVAMCLAAFSQLPYSWIPNVDPGWTTPDGGPLVWRPGCAAVTTNCSGQYGNSLNSSYVSPVINAICGTSSTIGVTFTVYGNIESGQDFLYFEYSLTDGSNWINPYGAGVGLTGNFGPAPGTTISPIILNVTSNIRFRFTFQSNGSVNSSGIKITDFDVVCNVVLPIDLISFTGKRIKNENMLSWTTLSEKDNAYFDIEWSVTPEYDAWTSVLKLNAFGEGDSQVERAYSGIHSDPVAGKTNYYRIIQVDKDGTRKTFNHLVSIDNAVKANPAREVVNMLGQIVPEDTPGFVIYIYEDGTKIKKYN